MALLKVFFSVQNFQNVENISFTDISGDGNKIAVNTYDDNFENRKIEFTKMVI